MNIKLRYKNQRIVIYGTTLGEYMKQKYKLGPLLDPKPFQIMIGELL